MARTLATFYVCGGGVGLLAAAGADGSPGRRWVLVTMGLSAAGVGVVLARWGSRFTRPLFHLLVAAATIMICTAVLVSPDPLSAMLVSTIITFIAMDAFFFFPVLQGLAQLVAAVAGVTACLFARGDMSVAHIAGIDTVVLAIAAVTFSLAQWASRASRDQLTGVRNRRGFDSALQELVVQSERSGTTLSAVLMDLDHFKHINDTFGHDVGDSTLRRLATQWAQVLPAHAVLARHGGDEFAILLPGCGGDQALSVVQHATQRLPDPAVSCGVAQHRPGDSAAQLMRRADSALYRAKAAGRGRSALWTNP